MKQWNVWNLRTTQSCRQCSLFRGRVFSFTSLLSRKGTPESVSVNSLSIPRQNVDNIFVFTLHCSLFVFLFFPIEIFKSYGLWGTSQRHNHQSFLSSSSSTFSLTLPGSVNLFVVLYRVWKFRLVKSFCPGQEGDLELHLASIIPFCLPLSFSKKMASCE